MSPKRPIPRTPAPFKVIDLTLGDCMTGCNVGEKLTMQQLEEKVAHLIRAVDELSDIVTAQQAEIDRLTRRVEMLMRREGEREAQSGGGVVLGDERPPHY